MQRDYISFEDGSTMPLEDFRKLFVEVEWTTGSFDKLIGRVDVHCTDKHATYHQKFISKIELANLKVLDDTYSCLTDLLPGTIKVAETTYADGDDIDEVLKDHKAYVFKGSDWPYFFNVCGKYVRSTTSNWHKYLYDKFGFISPGILEEYNGPDNEMEHLDE